MKFPVEFWRCLNYKVRQMCNITFFFNEIGLARWKQNEYRFRHLKIFKLAFDIKSKPFTFFNSRWNLIFEIGGKIKISSFCDWVFTSMQRCQENERNRKKITPTKISSISFFETYQNQTLFLVNQFQTTENHQVIKLPSG